MEGTEEGHFGVVKNGWSCRIAIEGEERMRGFRYRLRTECRAVFMFETQLGRERKGENGLGWAWHVNESMWGKKA